MPCSPDRHFRPLTAWLLLAGLFFSASVMAAEPALPPGMVLTTPQFSEEIPPVLREVQLQLSEGVLPKQNAAVWLLHIYGDEALDEPLHDVTLDMLGIKKMSPKAPLFVPIIDFVKTLPDVSPAEVVRETALLEQQLLEAGQRLWTAEQFPRLDSYLKVNEKTLSTLLIAADCPRYFAPLLAPELPSRLISASLVIERRLPFLVRMLAARSLLRMSEENFSGCLADLTACRKLAVLLAIGSPFDVSVAKGQVIDSMAFHAERALLESGALTLSDLRTFLASITALPEFPPAWKAADHGERAIIQQELELLKTDPDSRTGFFEDSDHESVAPEQTRSLDKIDWALAARQANESQDRIVAALKIPDRPAQLARFRELDRDYADWEAGADAKTAKFADELKQNRPGMSRWVGENMAMSLRPNYYQRQAADDRLTVRRGLIITGIALEIYRHEHGKYPAALVDLAPTLLAKVPQDACTQAPFVYQRKSSLQIRLMSLGTNRVDDAGQNFNDDVELKLQPAQHENKGDSTQPALDSEK